DGTLTWAVSSKGLQTILSPRVGGVRRPRRLAHVAAREAEALAHAAVDGHGRQHAGAAVLGRVDHEPAVRGEARRLVLAAVGQDPEIAALEVVQADTEAAAVAVHDREQAPVRRQRRPRVVVALEGHALR